jgi:hypothetical protein
LRRIGEYEPFTLCSADLTARLATNWHDVFCPSVRKWAQQKGASGFRWEKMSADFEGDLAVKFYRDVVAHEYFILPEHFAMGSFDLYQSCEKPFCSGPQPTIDCYIFPTNLAWTFALTHEAGWLGPYFLKHPEYDVLQKKNIDALNFAANK